MRLNRAAKLRHSGSLILGLAVALGFAASVRADSGDVRYVEVHSTLGQMYDTAIAADDAETFGLGIPRGTSLPRRMYPVRNLGVPMIQEISQPQYKEVLLRHPKRNHTEYLDPNPDTNQVVNPPAISVLISPRTQTIILSWPATAGNWRLESVATLNSGAGWPLVPPASYQTNGDTIFCVVAVDTSAARFFRLRKP